MAPTDDPTVSRLTLVTTGSDAVIQQIANQLNKLVDVVNVEDMTLGEHLERELVLLKLKVRLERTDTVRGHVVRLGGRVIDPAPDGFIVELTGSEAEVNTFINEARAGCGAALRSRAQRCARHRAQRATAASCTLINLLLIQRACSGAHRRILATLLVTFPTRCPRLHTARKDQRGRKNDGLKAHPRVSR